MLQQRVFAAPGCSLVVTTSSETDCPRVTLEVKTRSDCVLHWGVSRRPGAAWRCPPRGWWPEGTRPVDANAVRTPLTRLANDSGRITIELKEPAPALQHLAFALYLPGENRWVKNGSRDFFVELPRSDGLLPPEEALRLWVADAQRLETFTLDNGDRLAAATHIAPEAVRIYLASDAEGPLILHWGLVEKFRHEWKLPPEPFRPAGTTVFDNLAARTPFAPRDHLQVLELAFPQRPEGPTPRGFKFVLHQPATNVWLKRGGSELFLPLFEGQGDDRLPSAKLLVLAEEIVSAEVGKSSWTLMHRFHLCHDLLAQGEDDPEALALFFAWLRYSAIRQLDWQRNYNTKPRELSAAQDRLTRRLAGVWRRHPAGSAGRFWARLLLTTLGRGGEGQQVRDEILHIMHRNHIKEVRGTFMEEWHQKLHNNTTPDDVVICEAYLAFLRSNGKRDLFYQTLEQHGVNRQRLQNFERPIRTDPEFYADRKDALIRDFENFLRILKSVHAGTDLETAVAAARGRLDAGLQQQIDRLFGRRREHAPALEHAGLIVAIRDNLARLLVHTQDDGGLRDLLFLDLALEDALRQTIEQQELDRLQLDDLLPLVQASLGNLRLTTAEPELLVSTKHWIELLTQPHPGKDWALHAHSAAERVGRWVQGFTERLQACLQPKAEYLGEAFGVEKWVVPLFSEEIIRSGCVFAVARLLRHLDPLLRRAAGLGGWQVVSPATASGRVRVIPSLLSSQAERFAEPTVLVTDKVSGEEEIPEGVTAVLTTDLPDLVSHVAVRARNGRVLLATCYEAGLFGDLKKREGKVLMLRVTPAGDVEFQEGCGAGVSTTPVGKANGPVALRARPAGQPWVIGAEDFTAQVVGGKANNLNSLRGKLPDWIHLPRSLALPFGTFEKVLDSQANRAVRARLETLLVQAEQDPSTVLPQVRSLLQELTPPPELRAALLVKWQQAGLPTVSWELAWKNIVRVWASKWNERAYFSRRARGMVHAHLRMAVLIQQVVEADYAFVIHTANPLTGNPDELFAEVVLGLGETLVGNYPGRALGFVCRKPDLTLNLLSYPSKSVGLYGKGVIFRSDSNGEDLEGFAGAGLYDSFLAEEPEHRLLDYSGERLIWNTNFRAELLRGIARLGIAVEKVLGSPQDIEGAVHAGKFHVVQTRPQVGLEG